MAKPKSLLERQIKVGKTGPPLHGRVEDRTFNSERRISNQFYPLGSSEFKRGLKPPEFSREHKTDQKFFILIKAQSKFHFVNHLVGPFS